MVALGYRQTPDFHFSQTFCPVVKQVIMKFILSIALTTKKNLQKLDMNNTFINGILQEEVYMYQPKGFENTQILKHV